MSLSTHNTKTAGCVPAADGFVTSIFGSIEESWAGIFDDMVETLQY